LVTMVLIALIVGIIAAYVDVAVRTFNTYLANLE
jgi:hypothetical protein